MGTEAGGAPAFSGPTRQDPIEMGKEPVKAFGPMFLGGWSITDAFASELANASRPVPPPINALMLLDTGASRSVIDHDIVQQFGLASHRATEFHGAHGGHMTNLHRARLGIMLPDKSGCLTIELEVAAGPTGGGQQVKVIGIIGQDVLEHATFVYRRKKGTCEIDLDGSLRLFVKKGGRTRPGEESLPSVKKERPCPTGSLS